MELRNLKELSVFALLLSAVSFAGTPDQDPIVRERRERFQYARIPQFEDLKHGKIWRCIVYAAYSDSFHTDGPSDYFRFSEFDEQIISDISLLYRTFNFSLTSDNFVAILTVNFPHHKVPIQTYMYFRVGQSGDLLFENLFDSAENPQLVTGVTGISDHSKFAAQYGVCPVNRIKD